MNIKKSGLILRTIFASITILFASISTAASIVTGPLVSSGQQKGIEYMVYGQGRFSCGDYVQARRQADTGQYLQLNYYRHWMAGYMSGYNRYLLKGVGAVASKGAEQTIELGLEDYCREHPEDSFALAAASIMNELTKPGKQ